MTHTLAVAFLALLPCPVAAQAKKLNLPLAREATSSFPYPGYSPDGELLFYAVEDGSGTYETRSVALDGKHAPVVVEPAFFTRDGKRSLRLADPDGDGLLALFTSPVEGGSLVPLTDPFAAGGAITFGLMSTDGVHFVYLADQDSDEVVQLYAAPVDGRAQAHELSGPLVTDGDVRGMTLSGDGRVVAFEADATVDGELELFVVPVDGSTPARALPLPLVAGGALGNYALDFDGSHVVYAADQEEDERIELFSLPTDLSAPPRKLNGPLVAGGDVGASFEGQVYANLLLSPDGRWVVYTADQEVDERFELFSAPTDGSRAAVKLSRDEDRAVDVWLVSYDSAWVVYESSPSGASELFSVPVDGSAPARGLSGPMVPGGSAFFPQQSFDGWFVAWEADQLEDEVHELFGAPIDASELPRRLNAPFTAGGDLNVQRNHLLPGFWVTRDGVMYEADQEIDGLNELYFAPFPPGSPVRKLAAGPVVLPTPLFGYQELPFSDFGQITFTRHDTLFAVGVQPGELPVPLDALALDRVVGDVTGFHVTPDGERVLYVAREGTDASADLYSVSTGERRQGVQLHPEGTQASLPVLSPDGTRALFERTIGPAVQGLFVAPADGSAPAVLLTAQATLEHSFTPDGKRVVFQAVSGEWPHYFSVPSDGSAPAVLLSGALPAGRRTLAGAKVSANGSWVAFRSDRDELYVAPSDGSQAAVRVSALGQRAEDDFALAPDGRLVVYRAFSGARTNLFAAPGDASAPAVRLNPELANGRHVSSFALAPDGARVVYLADQTADDRSELYAVPSDASGPSVALLTVPADRDVLDFALAPDGSRVAFRADLVTDDVPGLFSVPAGGGAAPVRLGANALNYSIAADSGRVAFSSRSPHGSIVLLGAPLGGTRGATLLGRAPFAGGDVAAFQISADGSTVAFTAERNAGGRLTLLSVPIAGGEKAVELAGPFQGNGSVADFALDAAGTRAVWRADSEAPGVVELFTARTGRVAPAGLRWAALVRSR